MPSTLLDAGQHLGLPARFPQQPPSSFSRGTGGVHTSQLFLLCSHGVHMSSLFPARCLMVTLVCFSRCRVGVHEFLHLMSGTELFHRAVTIATLWCHSGCSVQRLHTFQVDLVSTVYACAFGWCVDQSHPLLHCHPQPLWIRSDGRWENVQPALMFHTRLLLRKSHCPCLVVGCPLGFRSFLGCRPLFHIPVSFLALLVIVPTCLLLFSVTWPWR